MFDEITMSNEAFLVILFLAVVFGAKYVAVIIGAIISIIVGIIRFLWLIIGLCAIGYAVYHIFSGVSFS